MAKCVPQDDVKAAKWYRKAAEQGGAAAQYSLGVMYATGRGVSQDDAEAVKWLRKVADQGYARAQYGLGFMYNYGRGVPESDVEAYAWVNIAADRGVQLAKKVKEPIAETMTREQRRPAQQLSREYWKSTCCHFAIDYTMAWTSKARQAALWKRAQHRASSQGGCKRVLRRAAECGGGLGCASYPG